MRRSAPAIGAVAVLVALLVLAAAAQGPADGRPIGPGDLVYAGAFRLPRGLFGTQVVNGQNVANFAYGGTALAFHEARNSLFLVGHDWGQLVAEVGIPEIRPSRALGDLATARLLQPFTDVTEGGMSKVGPNTAKIGGLMVYQNRLLVTVYLYYDGGGSQRLSHFVSSQNLSLRGDVMGPYEVGSLGAGFVSGYMGEIPAEWREVLGAPVLTGNCCLSVPSRTSFGPAVFGFDPLDLGARSAPATPFVYYPAAHPLAAWEATSPLFNGTTEITGVVFPRGTRSVLFFGRRGMGRFCYGPGTTDRALVGKPADGGVDVYCYDPAISYKGSHAYPYEYAMWAYDASDFVDAKEGLRASWNLRPYGTWKLDIPFAADHARILGAAYDPSRGRVFLSQAYGDVDFPVIHVFDVAPFAATQRGPRP